jgi:alkylated DNA repair protein (DNA oxidative demethylase)
MTATTHDLFDTDTLELAAGAWLLRGFASDRAPALLDAIDVVTRAAPFRHLVTPGGYTMSVAMTNCGDVGWVSDESGYRYDAIDPLSGARWPAMPALFSELAARAAGAAGFDGFVPDACLINRYAPRAKLSLHQDRDERDRGAPIVSVSLGVPATFLFGGTKRSDTVRRVRVEHGDVVVWGGPSRLAYHGVLPLGEAQHPLTGTLRLNLTLRKAR